MAFIPGVRNDKGFSLKNSNLQWKMVAPDGTDFGTVSSEGYLAYRENRLDSYKPKNQTEKDVIDKFRNYKGYEIKNPVTGNTLAKVSYDAVQALNKSDFDGYKTKDDDEKKVFTYFKTAPLYDLTTPDGAKHGKVSYETLKDINRVGIQNYTPKTVDEEIVIKGYINTAHKITNIPLEIKLDGEDKQNFGNVSYNALKAIESNTLDKYTPVNDSEKKALEKYEKYIEEQNQPDGFWSWLGKQVMAGVGNFNKGVGATLDFILPTEVLGEYDFVSGWNEEASQWQDYYNTQAVISSASKGGGGWDIAGNLVSGAVAALPNAVLAYMSAGTSLGASGGATIASANTATLGTTASATKQVVSNMMRNPSYWASALQTIGTDYEEAKARGANDFIASTSAILTTALNAGIEVGSGIEQLPKNLNQGKKKAIYNWVKSSFEEGGEEVLQKITTNAVAKMMYDHDAPIYSTTDENAVINPISLAKDFSMGVAVGGVLGGIQTTVAKGINTAKYIKAGKFYKKAGDDAVKFVVNTALLTPADSDAYKLAEKAQKKLSENKTLSDYEVGKIHLTTVAQVEAEHQDTYTDIPDSDAPVSVGDTFIDKKTNNILKVVGRDDKITTIEITTPNGKKEVITRTNYGADTLNVDDMFIPVVERGRVATPADNVAITEDATTTSAEATVYNMLTGENLTNKQIDTIMSNTALRGAFESLTGVKIEGSKAEQRAIIRGWQNNSANVENLKHKNVGGKGVSLTDAHTKVNELLGQLNGKNIGEIIRSETLTKAFEDLTGISLEGTTANKRATVREYAERAKQVYAESVSAGNGNIQQNLYHSDENSSNTGEATAENKIAVVVGAMNNTFLPGAEEAIYESMPPNVEKSLDVFAEMLMVAYEKHHTIGHIADYFSDGGKKVVEAIESTLDTATEKTSEAELSNTESESNLDNNLDNENVVEIAQNKEEVLKNEPESDTIEEKITKAVPDAGKSHTVAYTNDNERVDLSFKIISVDDLVVSNSLDGKLNPDYPQELQPRDRNRTSSQSQIRQMANSLNPARLAESTSVSEGSPIVGADNVVESGNGRTLAIKLAYEIGTADEYKNHIIRNADKYGIDVSNLPEKPILVRERLTEVDRTEFTRKANESSISSLSATEQAKVDAENLTEDVLNLLVANEKGIINTSDNKSFISAVLSKVFKNEDLNNVVNAEGNLSTRGLERIKNAIFYKAYGDASLSARLSESLDNDMKNATTVLLNVAPKIVVIKNGIASEAMYDFDFSKDIANAIRLFEKCRNNNMSIEDYAMQTSMFEVESPLTMAMAYVFETKNRGAKQATDFYNILLDTVIELGNPNQISLDIFEVYQTKEEILDATFEKFNTGAESKNAITTPESVYKSASEKGRENDRRGNDEVFWNESNEKEKVGNAVGVQQDNRRSEETRVVDNDEQLRQENESVHGQPKVESVAKEIANEREEKSNEQIGSNSLSENGRRGHNGSTRKQTGRISYFERRNKGKNATERQSFARELIERGQVEEVTQKIGKHTYKYTLVKSEAFNDDMLSMVEEARSKGIELGFFIGNAKVNFDSKNNFVVDGIKISDSQILVQYDEDISPQKIFKHEVVHAKWKTRAIQKIKNTILDNLSESDINTILSQERYKRYMKIYKGNTDIVLEEFVCDVMAGMNEYTNDYVDAVVDYWYGSEAVDNYKVSEYTESIDAGGRYSLLDDFDSYPVWTEDVLDDFEFGKLESSLLDIESGINANHYNRSTSGEYIIQTDNKLIYTNGKYSNPEISKIIEFRSEEHTSELQSQ